jgi:hypothetical protein
VTTLINLRILAQNVLNDIEAFDGSTQSAIPGVLTVTSGYGVSLPGHEHRIAADVGRDKLLTTITEYAEGKRSLLARPGRYLGAWVSDGTLFLDITEVHAEFATAVRLGWERNQLAIWNYARNSEIATRPGRRTFVTEEQTLADKLAHETGLVRDYFKRLGNTHGAIMASVTTPEDPSPFEVVGVATYDATTDSLS